MTICATCVGLQRGSEHVQRHLEFTDEYCGNEGHCMLTSRTRAPAAGLSAC